MQSRKIIKLPAGGELELDFEDKFLEAVRLHVNKGVDEEVTDDDIRLMIFNCFSGAINDATNPDESN